jgi:hypothetical protein
VFVWFLCCLKFDAFDFVDFNNALEVFEDPEPPVQQVRPVIQRQYSAPSMPYVAYLTQPQYSYYPQGFHPQQQASAIPPTALPAAFSPQPQPVQTTSSGNPFESDEDSDDGNPFVDRIPKSKSQQADLVVVDHVVADTNPFSVPKESTALVPYADAEEEDCGNPFETPEVIQHVRSEEEAQHDAAKYGIAVPPALLHPQSQQQQPQQCFYPGGYVPYDPRFQSYAAAQQMYSHFPSGYPYPAPAMPYAAPTSQHGMYYPEQRGIVQNHQVQHEEVSEQ